MRNLYYVSYNLELYYIILAYILHNYFVSNRINGLVMSAVNKTISMLPDVVVY